MTRKLPRKTFAALGAVFDSETQGRPLFQSRAKIYQQLCDEGLLKRKSLVLGGPFPVTIEGYVLTLRGHYAYCGACDDGAPQ